MAKIDNGCVGMMRLCNWIPTEAQKERQEKELAQEAIGTVSTASATGWDLQESRFKGISHFVAVGGKV